jgi:hypothetical protein
VDQLRKRIQQDKNWYNQIVDKARKNGKSTETQLAEDIDYMWTTEGSKKASTFMPFSYVAEIRRNIVGSPDWRAKVEENARKNNRSFDAQVEEEARYLWETSAKETRIVPREGNPPAGEYEVLVVALTPAALGEINPPKAIVRLGPSGVGSARQNPFRFFRNLSLVKKEGISIKFLPHRLVLN